ncbi:hypothetical protein Syun_005684 [Stephania yunnanensis]|uniref:Uncharacterized protein n=1 Tax=Stephania yunnanensis TaxID=152371 RepID=A0AAP0Q1Z4_9MAGN
MDDVMAGYKRVGVERPAKQQRSAGRGFRVNSRRFSVQRVRARFLYFIRNVLILKWRISSSGSSSSCWLASIKRTLGNVSCRRSSSSRRGLVVVDADQQQKHYCSSSRYSHNKKNSSCRLKSFGRSNSFYSEAIADCLEFIKRSSSVSVDDHSPPVEQS